MSQKKDGKSKIILVVDDEPDICEAMQLALGMEGYDCRAALERDDALRLSNDSRPSVILLDYRMPGLDAAEFVAQLRSQKVKAPVTKMTAERIRARRRVNWACSTIWQSHSSSMICWPW